MFIQTPVDWAEVLNPILRIQAVLIENAAES
jgi:hypothetical protein